MHILLIHQVFVRPQDPGGTRHYELARYLAHEGHRVTILAGRVSYLTGHELEEDTGSWMGEGICMIRCAVVGDVHRSFLWRTIGYISFMLSAFWAGLRVSEVDLIWGTSPPLFQGCTAWALSRIKRVPWAFEVRDLWPAFAIQVGVLRNQLLISISRFVERFLYRSADQIIVNSPGFNEHIVQSGASAENLAVIPNGVDPAQFFPEDTGSDLRRSFGWENRFIVLYAGAHGLSNDLNVLLEAAELLPDESNVLFVLMGDGKEKPHLMMEADAKRLENLQFIPPVPKSEVPRMFTAMDCGIAILKPIPLYATTYPNKVFDYMAAGRPVVLAIEGVIREVVEAANGGISVPPGDPQALSQAVLELSSRPDQARRMGSNGRIFVEAHFDRKQIAAQLLALFLNMIGGGDQGGTDG